MFLNNFKNAKEATINNSNLSSDEKDLALDGLYSLVDDMRSFGVNDSLGIKDYFYIKHNAPAVLNKIANIKLSDNQLDIACKSIFDSRHKAPLDSLYNMYCLASDSLKQLNLTIKKIAYPQGDMFVAQQQSYNINNWLSTAKEVVKLKGQGISRDEAVKKATSNWDNIQQMKFDKWLTFYEQGEHMKYKMAQISPQNLVATIPGVPSRYASEIPDLNSLPEEPAEVAPVQMQPKKVRVKVQDLSPQEAKDRMQSRLNSIEKLFSNSDAFRKLLGGEYAKWLEHIQALKRAILLTNPRYAASKMFEDLIYREGNKLQSGGFVKAAQVMFKIAQDAGPPPPDSLEPSDPTMPMQEDELQDPKGDRAMTEFVDSMNGNLGGLDDIEEEASPDMGMGDMGMGGMGLTTSYKPNRIVMGQVAPNQANPNEAAPTPQEEVVPPPQEEVATPNPNDTVDSPSAKKKTNDVIGDDKIENALSGVTLAQATMKAEYIAQLYKSRLISRELQILDLYLQALDIDMYFNQELSEALNRALDSNQYGLTRVENILAKLRGASSENISIEQIRNKFNQKMLEQEKVKQDKIIGTDEDEVATEKPAAPEANPKSAEPAPATKVEPDELAAKPQIEQQTGVRV